MKEIEILGWYILVEGFDNVRISDIQKFLKTVRNGIGNCQVQFLNAKMIAGIDHIYFAVLNALRGFSSKASISKNLSMEILLFLSGQHQIRKAVEILGIKSDSSQIVAVIMTEKREEGFLSLDYVSEVVSGELRDDVIELTDDKVKTIKKIFGITSQEIEATLRDSEKDALTNLLIERAALLVTHR